MARDALVATPGGLGFEWCAVIGQISPMARSRVRGARGSQRLVAVLTRCGLARPVSVVADAKHRRCRTEPGYRPTLVRGRVLWPLGDTEAASAAALPQSDGVLQRMARQQEPAYRVRGILTAGFDSPNNRLRTLFPGTRLGTGGRHAGLKRPGKRAALASPVRQAWRSRFHTLVSRARQHTGWRIVALGQRVRHVAHHVTATAGTAHGARVRRWMQEKNAGWSAVVAESQMPAPSTLRAQTHHAIARHLFAMKGCHPPGGSP